MTTVCCDKTGTLTHGDFALAELIVLSRKGKWADRKFVVKALAIMEKESSHPMAAALVVAAKNEGIEVGEKDTAENHIILKGEGGEGE